MFLVEFEERLRSVALVQLEVALSDDPVKLVVHEHQLTSNGF